jgi:hypothetical protein
VKITLIGGGGGGGGGVYTNPTMRTHGGGGGGAGAIIYWGTTPILESYTIGGNGTGGPAGVSPGTSPYFGNGRPGNTGGTTTVIISTAWVRRCSPPMGDKAGQGAPSRPPAGAPSSWRGQVARAARATSGRTRRRGSKNITQGAGESPRRVGGPASAAWAARRKCKGFKAWTALLYLNGSNKLN